MIISTITPVKIFRTPDGQLSRPLSRIERQLQSLKAQKTQHEIRPIISDMSADPEIREQIAQIAHKYGASYLFTPSTLVWNKSLCLNIGIQAASPDTKYLATLDMDLLYREDVFPTCIELAERHTGKSPLVLCRTFLYQNNDYRGDYTPAAFNRLRSRGKFLILSGNGGIQFFDYQWILKHRGYDERYNLWGGPDNEIVKRAEVDGCPVLWISRNTGQIYLLHLWHPQWFIPGLPAAFISNYRKTVNHKFVKEPVQITANPHSWGEEKTLIGPRFIDGQLRIV